MRMEWIKGFEPELIIGRLRDLRKLDGDKVSFNGMFEMRHNLALLKSMIEPPPAIPIDIADQLVERATFAAAKTHRFNSEDVILCIEKAFKGHLGKRPKASSLVTTLSLSKANLPPPIPIRGCTVTFFSALPGELGPAREKAAKDFKDVVRHKERRDYAWVVAETTAKSSREAASACLNAIDLMRGMWNMAATSPARMTLSGRPDPINAITLGELHTLHKEDGSIVDKMCWYERDYCEDQKLYNYGHRDFAVRTYADRILARLQESNYRDEMEEAIIRYVRALDCPDYDVAFTRLWQILEHLTCTIASYDTTIKRVSFLYDDWKYARQVLRHLRAHRNAIIHKGLAHRDTETFVYQLKGYVEAIIRFHLGSKPVFRNLADAAEFLDLPTDLEKLRERLDMHTRALTYRAPVQSKSG